MSSQFPTLQQIEAAVVALLTREKRPFKNDDLYRLLVDSGTLMAFPPNDLRKALWNLSSKDIASPYFNDQDEYRQYWKLASKQVPFHEQEPAPV